MLAFRGANLHLKCTGWTPLISAAYNGYDVVIETLVAFGADINATTSALWSVLMLAVHRERTDTVRLLLSLNADANENKQR